MKIEVVELNDEEIEIVLNLGLFLIGLMTEVCGLPLWAGKVTGVSCSCCLTLRRFLPMDAAESQRVGLGEMLVFGIALTNTSERWTVIVNLLCTNRCIAAVNHCWMAVRG